MTPRYAIPARLLVFLMTAGACEQAGLRLSHPDSAVHGQDGSRSSKADGAVDVSLLSEAPSSGGPCPEGLSACGKGDGLACHDLSRSRDHCGACGQACAPGVVCQDGTCQQYRCKGALSFKALADSAGTLKTMGDFDGDGILDLVVSPEAGGVALLYGAGNGTFSGNQAIESALVPTTWQASAADLDGDGFQDLINTSAVPSTIVVRRASGDRSAPFGEPTSYASTSDALSGILLADLDGDGRVDLVVGASKGLEYWRGQGGGRFAHQAMLDSPDMNSWEPGVPMAVDWNGDGVLDLVYGSFGFGALGFFAIGGGGNLLFRLGHGDGSFDSEVACALLPGVIGDLDHDGRPDLINEGSNLQGASLLLGIDVCHASRIIPLSDWPKQGGIALADFNGDGNLDVVADYDKNIAVRVGDGKGGFAQSLNLSAYETGQWPIGIFLTGDLNRDGKLDFIFSRDGRWGVFLNTCQ